MWFKLISIALAALCLGKAALALAAPQHFYRLRLRQYAAAERPWSIFLAPVYVLALAALSWYALLAHPAPWGWVLTLFLSLIGLLAVANLLRWSRHRTAVAAAIAERPAARARVDLGIAALGAGFLALALLVY